ncbi:MAG: hypothetical protein HFF61_06590 [Oscillospiraceae bacterium]|jgi:hypothetical protein|nr:hypothetical protein [Oscillospiraceae bacterium]
MIDIANYTVQTARWVCDLPGGFCRFLRPGKFFFTFFSAESGFARKTCARLDEYKKSCLENKLIRTILGVKILTKRQQFEQFWIICRRFKRCRLRKVQIKWSD